MIKQANVFLEDAGEFYPFGTMIDKDGDVIPVGVYDEKEYLPSVEVIEILEKELLNYINDEGCLIVAIGVDVLLNNKEKKQNALMIKTSYDGLSWSEQYYPYHTKNKVFWE